MVEDQRVSASTKSVEATWTEGQPNRLRHPQPLGVEGNGQKAQPNRLTYPQPPSVEQRKLTYLLIVGISGYVPTLFAFPFVGAVSRSEKAHIGRHARAVATPPLPPPNSLTPARSPAPARL